MQREILLHYENWICVNGDRKSGCENCVLVEAGGLLIGMVAWVLGVRLIQMYLLVAADEL